jgi:hypothetical protein
MKPPSQAPRLGVSKVSELHLERAISTQMQGQPKTTSQEEHPLLSLLSPHSILAGPSLKSEDREAFDVLYAEPAVSGGGGEGKQKAQANAVAAVPVERSGSSQKANPRVTTPLSTSTLR